MCHKLLLLFYCQCLSEAGIRPLGAGIQLRRWLPYKALL